MEFFYIDNIAFTCWGYPLSYVELIGTLFGLISVYYASKGNILTWPTGLVNELFLLILFFQVQLYADMFLQFYFFIVTVFGWYNWRNIKSHGAITTLNFRSRLILVFMIVLFAVAAGFIIKDIHLHLPHYFRKAAAYPFVDSLVMVLSIFATVLLAKKKIENWVLWLLVDIISIALFLTKEVYFLALEYFIFLGLASYGFYNWTKQLSND